MHWHNSWIFPGIGKKFLFSFIYFCVQKDFVSHILFLFAVNFCCTKMFCFKLLDFFFLIIFWSLFEILFLVLFSSCCCCCHCCIHIACICAGNLSCFVWIYVGYDLVCLVLFVQNIPEVEQRVLEIWNCRYMYFCMQ